MRQLMHGLVAAAVVTMLATVASAAEKKPCYPTWTPRFICVCPSPCKKEMPCVDWDWCSRCDDYCKKPMPCVNACVKYLCDTYECKPEPCCYPKAPCPVR